MGRTPCCDKNGLKKCPWTTEEDQKLTNYIQIHGPGNWRTLPKIAGKQLFLTYLHSTYYLNMYCVSGSDDAFI